MLGAMGPIALFDKSFLQALSLDESVWFEHFFYPTICSLFYVETLADLTKSGDAGRRPEDQVRIIADKTPVQSDGPCVHHRDLCVANLMGHPVPMTGQIPLAGGRMVKGPDGKGSDEIDQMTIERLVPKRKGNGISMAGRMGSATRFHSRRP